MSGDHGTRSCSQDGPGFLIIEPHSSGHRASYVRWLVRAARDLRVRIVVATSDERDRTTTMKDVEDMIADPRCFVSIGLREPVGMLRPLALERVRGQWRYYCWFRRVYREVSASLGPVRVIVPYVDYFVDVAGLVGSPFADAEWVGITMRSWTADGSGPAAALRRRLLRRLAGRRSLRAMFSINNSDTGAEVGDSGADRLPLQRLVDPAELSGVPRKEIARARLGLPLDRLVLLVFGTMDERKGLRQLFAGLDAIEVQRRPVVLIVGRQHEPTRGWLQSKVADGVGRSEIFVIDKFVDDEIQGLAFGASDVIWVGYVGHQAMSGVLVLAGVCGLPVIGCCEGEIGRMIRSTGMGIGVDVKSPASVAAAVLALRDPEVRRKIGNAAGRAVRGHSPEAFAATILGAFDQEH